jgi:hypothetical protein
MLEPERIRLRLRGETRPPGTGRYVYGPVRVIGVNHYGLDGDGNRIGCE